MPLPWFANNAFPLFLAPMAGVTDPIFRSICKKMGADVMVTEFVSSEGIIQCWERNRRYTEFDECHRPLGIQLFGADGARMGEAAKIVLEQRRPDFIDINFGCPVPKVVGKNGGSSLLKDLPTLASVVRGVIASVGKCIPVTAKIRTGWDSSSICALETCRILQEEGIAMITIHGRTRSQQYSGEADWELIHQCADSISVPVIGNGDIRNAAMAANIKAAGYVRGIMIGRAAMENPWIFKEISSFLKTGNIPSPPTAAEKWRLMIQHTSMALDSGRYGNELQTMKFMRTRLIAYAKGFPKAKELRGLISKVESMEQLKAISSNDAFL